MDNKDSLKNINTTQRLVQIDEYYNYVFKKTEKIVSVVFYVANKISDERAKSVFEDILASAREAHNTVLQSLETRLHVAEEELRAIAHKLIILESKLRIAESSGYLAPEAMHVFASEIDGVLRNVNKFLRATSAFDDVNYGLGSMFGIDMQGGAAEHTAQPTRTAVPSTAAATSTPTNAASGSRRDRIKTVLKTKPEASIKDIAEVITDCSEKTLQRELNAMIDDHEVERIGERRWSKYILA